MNETEIGPARTPSEPGEAQDSGAGTLYNPSGDPDSLIAARNGATRLAERECTAERFWALVDKTGECWIWQGPVASNGYGRFTVALGKRIYAHQFSYGDVPDGCELDHLCRVQLCVRRIHLEAVEHRINVLRGVSPAAINAGKTRCINGHQYTETNTYIRPDGRGRGCSECRNNRNLARYR